MRYFKKLSWLAFLGVFLGITSAASAQSISNCDRALGEQNLDVNVVRARILNGGGLFYRGEPHMYEIPKGSGHHAIFASGIWVAGQVGGQLRAAATRYGEWEFWAGPLDDQGSAPADCSIFDRVYKVSRSDVKDYDAGGSAPPDLRDWPTGLGAPTLDANGDPIEILSQPLASRVGRVVDLAAGERPALLGDQSIWWVMNDRGNIHESTDAPAIGLEVHGLAFAFDVAGDIGVTTFYKYNIFYRGSVPLENAYVSLFSDPDLGNFDDDYVGSDSTLGMGYVYNSDNDDEGGEGFGSPAPAAGYDFFQGPIVPSPGDVAYVSGVAVPDFKNLQMTSFVFYNNGGGVTEDPRSGQDYYNYMQANWKDGQKITFGGDGRTFSTIPTNYMFPSDPAKNEFWTERNADGAGASNSPADRRFVMSTGPFTINPGDQQEIVFGIVFATGTDNWDSVTAMKRADALAQAAFDVNFVLPHAPDRPEVSYTELNGKVILEWSNKSNSNNFLESYTQIDPFADLADQDYLFEGYKIWEFTEAADQVGKVIATYDVSNGITRVVDGFPGEPTAVTADGSDSGVQLYHDIPGLVNYRTYYYGVQAYSYNALSNPMIFPSPIVRIEVIPRKSEDVISEAAIEASLTFGESDFEINKEAVGDGIVAVDIVNPAVVLDATDYSVKFREMEITAGKADENIKKSSGAIDDVKVGEQPGAKSGAATGITYDIFRGGTVVFDGNVAGDIAPQRTNVTVVDGLQFSVTGPNPGISGFQAVANAAGPIDPPDMAAFAFNSSGFPRVEGRDRPSGTQQTNGSTWGFHTGGSTRSKYGDEAGPFNQGQTFIGRSVREGWGPIGSDNYEWRFTQACADAIDGTVAVGDCLAWRGFEDGALVEIPFSVWNVGPTGDTADDYRMLPLICESACGGGTNDFEFDLGEDDHAISGGANDPYTDWIYMYKPEDNGASPGEQGYLDFFHGSADNGDRTFSRMVLVNWNGGTDRPYDAELPEVGTVFRIVTLKPNQIGDTFSFNTTGFGTQEAGLALKQERLDAIGIVPNPYKGTSAFEISQLQDEARFTNLPSEQTTISIFTLNGTLIRTFVKPAGSAQLKWDLTTANTLPIASGIYLIHFDVDGVGSKVVKFAVVKKRLHLNTF